MKACSSLRVAIAVQTLKREREEYFLPSREFSLSLFVRFLGVSLFSSFALWTRVFFLRASLVIFAICTSIVRTVSVSRVVSPSIRLRLFALRGMLDSCFLFCLFGGFCRCLPCHLFGLTAGTLFASASLIVIKASEGIGFQDVCYPIGCLLYTSDAADE